MNNCIYFIKNSIDNYKYVGRTFNFKQRKNRHLNELRKNKHHNVSIQKGLPQNRKKVFCEGDIFESLGLASTAYNITPGAMHNRIKSTKEKFKEFYYL